MTRALVLQLCRKEFPQRQKVVRKQVEYLLGGKRVQYLRIETQADSGRVPELALVVV